MKIKTEIQAVIWKINLEVGQEYLTYLLDLEVVSRNLIFLATAYNGGPGNLQKWKKESLTHINLSDLF